MILYLHGFRSSPQSFKARLMEKAMAARGASGLWRCPQLPASPAAAIIVAREMARELIDAGPDNDPSQLAIVGSSLGGYYATWLAEELGARAVLLNPAVQAPRDLATQVGSHTEFHRDAPFVFLPEYVCELAAISVARITRPERYLLVAATGDEVLNWQDMRDFFPGCQQMIIQGSDHGLSDFETWLPEVMDFTGHA